MEIRHYVTSAGEDVFDAWRESLKDRATRRVVDRRINRLELGNIGDAKPVGDGVWELRIDFGPGFRVYYALIGKAVVLLLGAGDKDTQQRDIERAILALADWRRREHER